MSTFFINLKGKSMEEKIKKIKSQISEKLEDNKR